MIVRRFLILITISVGIAAQPTLGSNMPLEQQDRQKEKVSRKKTAVITASALAVSAVIACLIANQLCRKRIVSSLQKRKGKAKGTVNTKTEETVSAVDNARAKETVSAKDKARAEEAASAVEEIKEIRKNYADATPEEIKKALGENRYVPEYSDELMENIAELTDGTALADEVNELVEAGNLQEIIWRLREEGMVDKADRFEKYISDTLATGEFVKEGESFTVKFANGIEATAYPYTSDEIHSELMLAMYRLDKLVGTNTLPMMVRRGDKLMELNTHNLVGTGQIRKLREAEGVVGTDVPISKEVSTFRLLSSRLDSDDDMLLPLKGRAIDINYPEYAFRVTTGDPRGRSLSNLWESFSASQGKKLDELSHDDLLKMSKDERHTVLGYQKVDGHLTDPEFIARLEKITPEQVDEVAKPIYKAVAEIVAPGNDAVREYLQRRYDFKSRFHDDDFWEANVDWIEDNSNIVDQISDKKISLYRRYVEYDQIGDLSGGPGGPTAGLHQRILNYIAVVKGTGGKATKQQ